MSSAPLRVFLSITEEKTLFELSQAEGVPQRTKDRASAIRLSSMGWKVGKIAVYLKWSKDTVSAAIHRWLKDGLVGLWDKHRSGRKKKWSKVDLVEIEEKLAIDQESYNSKKLRKFLLSERKIDLSERHIRRILKKADAPPRRSPPSIGAPSKSIDGKELENLSKVSKIRKS